MKRAMKLISMILALAIILTVFPGLTVCVAAASNEWQVYSEHCYYNGKTDYHVIFYFQESYKTSFWGLIKRPYVSRMKVECYETIRCGNRALVNNATSLLVSNSDTELKNCLEYLQKYYPDLYCSYESTLQNQDFYRMLYCHLKKGESLNTFMRKYCNYTMNEIIKVYQEKVRKKLFGGFKGTVDDAFQEVLGFEIPTPLKLLGSASDVNKEVDQLEALCLNVVGILNGMVTNSWYYFVDLPQMRRDFEDKYGDESNEKLMERLADGTPSVETLLCKIVEEYATEISGWNWETLDSQKRVELADGIFTHSLS